MSHTEESLLLLAMQTSSAPESEFESLRLAIREVLAERDELKAALHLHYDFAPQRYAAAKEALPILERSMQCPICNTEFADGVLHDTGLALIDTFDRMTKAEAECERLRTENNALRDAIEESGVDADEILNAQDQP
jgi:hypothetical protein